MVKRTEPQKNWVEEELSKFHIYIYKKTKTKIKQNKETVKNVTSL